jgi:hypothetical protein
MFDKTRNGLRLSQGQRKPNITSRVIIKLPSGLDSNLSGRIKGANNVRINRLGRHRDHHPGAEQIYSNVMRRNKQGLAHNEQKARSFA